MIVERLMKPGTMDIQLIPETPKSIRDVLQPFGHILIHEARVDPRIMADEDLWQGALYEGVLRRLPTPFQLSGASTLVWAGDEEGKAWQVFDAGITGNWSFLTWLTNLGLGVGGNPIGNWSLVATPGGALVTQTFKNVTPRVALDWLCSYFTTQSGVAIEYKVWKRARLSAGPSTGIFVWTPTVIATPREGGRDLSLVGIEPSIFDVETDADSYTSKVVLVGGAGQGNSGGASAYKDAYGNAATMTRVVQSSQTGAGQEVTVAGSQLALYGIRQIIKLSSDRYDIPHDVRAGDWLYVYDPRFDIVDLTNPQNYRGQVVYPIKLRVFALTWPVESGMGVYYRDLNGVYTDLTPWVQFENPGTTFELGAPARGLTVF